MAELRTAVNPWQVALSLGWRETVRFFRQRNRIVGAIGTPIVFWLLFGAGLRQSFRPEIEDSPTFMNYFFSGTMLLIVMFTAIFATISIIEDRREGFLQSVLVAPIQNWSMVLGKVAGGTTIAMVQGILFLACGLIFRVDISWLAIPLILLVLLIVSAGITAMGFVFAWRMESTQGFHAIMNLVLMPMWLLSGAFFPIPLASSTEPGQLMLHWMMRCNPLSYCLATIRSVMMSTNDLGWSPSMMTQWFVTIGFTIAAFALACRVSHSRIQGDVL